VCTANQPVTHLPTHPHTRVHSQSASNTPTYPPTIIACSHLTLGTLLGIDINLDRMAARETVDVFGTLNQMRRERISVVQTEEQCERPLQETLLTCLLTHLNPRCVHITRSVG
jgi:hypothetical protein